METTENSLTTSIRTMHPLLTCIECGSQGSRISFHTDQWSNGEGNARCKSCVGGSKSLVCSVCKRGFSNDEDFSMHRYFAHRRRAPACSFCGDKRILDFPVYRPSPRCAHMASARWHRLLVFAHQQLVKEPHPGETKESPGSCTDPQGNWHNHQYREQCPECALLFQSAMHYFLQDKSRLDTLQADWQLVHESLNTPTGAKSGGSDTVEETHH